jgi:hypothetical protein
VVELAAPLSKLEEQQELETGSVAVFLHKPTGTRETHTIVHSHTSLRFSFRYFLSFLSRVITLTALASLAILA